jgi:glycosyltransferase involved in cell wall biosynthesis
MCIEVKPKPKITVLMAVYNGEQYLKEAVESILGQNYQDFEFLIINDGSTDRTSEIIRSYDDPRIHMVENVKNRGLIESLNLGFDLAESEFIARMDADDISLPDRLGKQLNFMKKHPEIGVCGGWIEYFMGKELLMNFPATDEEIKKAMVNYNPIAHPTVLMRSELLKQNSIYFDPEYQHVEDYELWVRLASMTKFANIPEVLLKYRIHSDQIGRVYSKEQEIVLGKIRAKAKKCLAFDLQTTSDLKVSN